MKPLRSLEDALAFFHIPKEHGLLNEMDGPNLRAINTYPHTGLVTHTWTVLAGDKPMSCCKELKFTLLMIRNMHLC